MSEGSEYVTLPNC